MAGLAHPSFKFLGIAKTLLLIALVLCLVAVVVPSWSRIKGAGVTDYLSYLDYASTSISTDSTLYIGLWQWCLYYGNNDDGYTCGNTRPSVVPSYGNKKCQGFMLATQVTSCIALGFLVVAFLMGLHVTKKVASWNAAVPWKAPKGPLALVLLLTLLALGLAIAAWACWFVLAEYNCNSNITSWNPVQGYSTSFILMTIVSGLLLIALIPLLLAFMNLKKVPALPVYEEVAPVMYKQEVVTMPDTTYPVVVDSPYMASATQYPVAYSTTPVY